jgi:CPA2 family monovalent cation:H+ antiporter-2
MEDASFLGEALIFLLAAVLVGPLFERFKSSPVLGFLVAGMLIGPYGLGLVAESATTRRLGELGVVFLLFTIGLELSIERLKVMRRQVFGLGTAQVLLTGLVITFAATLAGLGTSAAIIVGGGLALSSTAVVLQLLSERGELASRFGRACVAVLLLQDLAVVPMLTLVPALGNEEISILRAAGVAFLKAAAVLTAILVIGRLVLRPLFRLVAAGRSPELFAAMTLLVLLGTSRVTGQAGLSIGLGGFLAGAMLAETEYRHQVAADILPFRGILLGLFFMTVGMSVNLGVLVADMDLIGLLVAALIVGKLILVYGLCRAFGLAGGPSLNAGMMLAQGGEFAFLLFALALANGILSTSNGAVLFAVVAVSMALTPVLAAIGARLAARVAATEAVEAQDLASETAELRGHVVVAGFGRVGRAVCRMLAEGKVPYVALDLEPERVARARAQGLPVFYGDAAQPAVLRGAGVEHARSAVLTMDDPAAAERAAAGLRASFPDTPIFARARDNPHRERLESAGATGIVHETLGLSLELGGAVLKAIEEEDKA